MAGNYGNGGTFDYGNVLRNVNEMHNRNALTQNRLDPNSMDNRLRAAQIAELEREALNPSGDGRVSPVSFKDATAESLAEYQRSGDASVLVRHYTPYKPWTADTKTHREFWDIDVNTREPVLIKSIPIENFNAARDSELGKASASEGGFPSYAGENMSVTAGQAPDDIVGGGNMPAMKPVPSAAVQGAKIETAKAEAAEVVKYKVQKANMAKSLKMYTNGAARLREALEKTITGPFVGQAWPVTAQAQVAKQAKAMMLPILKQIVRGPGEGVFTDQDAIAVLDLIPDRIVDEDARDQIFANMEGMMNDFLTPVNPFPEERESGGGSNGTSGGDSPSYSQEDLEFTAKKHGITVEEVKKRLEAQ